MALKPLVMALAAGLLAAAPARALPAKPLPIRVVVVTAFEVGADTGDQPGEFQAWAAHLPQRIAAPALPRNLRYDPATGVLAISIGEGTGHAAASIMALGEDRRFDLTHAYWLVAAIAGVNPHAASIGSAAWIGDIIDTDFSYYIDPREIPADWTTGFVPMNRARPYAQPLPDSSDNLFALDKGLRDWAYALTRHVALPDNADLAAERAPYVGEPAALLPPHVLVGAEASGQAFWLGEVMNRETEKWTAYWTGGQDRFVMTAMEDTGVARALAMLGREGRVDPRRLLVLRTASDYSTPPAGMAPAALLQKENRHLPGLQASLDAAYLVGHVVVDELVRHWSLYADHLPAVPAP